MAMVPKGYWSVTSHVIWRLCPNLGSEIPPRPSTSRQPRPTSTDLAQPRNFSTNFGDFDLRPELTTFWAEVARGRARSREVPNPTVTRRAAVTSGPVVTAHTRRCEIRNGREIRPPRTTATSPRFPSGHCHVTRSLSCGHVI